MSAREPVLIPAFNPGAMTGTGNNTYLLPGPASALIDAGVGRREHLEAIKHALDSEGHGPVADVFITHAHPDHVSGAARLREEWPSLRFWKFPWSSEDSRIAVPFMSLADGVRFRVGDEALEVVHTPGHSPDHCCFWLARGRILLCGDLMQDRGTVVIPASRGGNMAAYLASLRRVSDLAPARGLPAHGGPIERPLELIKTYLEHRLEREEQIIEAMRGGDITVQEIVTRVYPARADALAGAARDTVVAHLIKLDQDGRAEQVGGTWRLRPDAGAPSPS